ncbi:MAG: hypothetical protein J6U54_25435 [Clostridiales bacterium]|nr:hypothetical protein [Clostridiales bacterium]
MKRSRLVISVFLATIMTITALSACNFQKKEDDDDGINRVTIILPEASEEEEIANLTAGVTINSYLTARAYLDLILEYDTKNMSEEEAEEFVKLIDDATILFDNTELLSYELTDAVDAWEESGGDRDEAELKELSTSPMNTFSFSQNVYADEKSSAKEWAEDIVKTFDNAQPGKGLRTLAEQMGTDAKHAYAQLKQAQAILEGAAYTDVADKADTIVTGLKTLKAAGTTASFVIAVTAAPASVGLIETGGILCTGVSAVAQVGSLGSQIICGTENNYVSATLDKLDDGASKIGTVFGFIGLGTALPEIGKTGTQILSKGWNSLSDSAKESFVNNSLGVVSLASSEVTNYLDDGSLLGGAIKVTDKGTEFTLMDTLTGKKDADTDRAKDLLNEIGLNKSDIKKIMKEDDSDGPDDALPKDVAKQLIEDNEPLTPNGGFDPNGFIEGVAEEIGKDPATVETDVTDPEITETDETDPEITETEPTESETEPSESETEPTETEITETSATAGDTDFFDTLELSSVDNWIIFLEGSWYGDVPWYSYDEEGNGTKGGTIPTDIDVQTLILSYTVSQEVLSDGSFVAYYIEGNNIKIEKIDKNTILVTQSDFPEDAFTLARE